jgi:enamine deaminase RidA (YjgF/YER057c/UK114 family)
MTSPEFPDAAERGSGGKVVHPEGWASPRGFSDAIVAEGKVVALAGQIGWNPSTLQLETEDFVDQTRQALHNIVTLLLESGARPQDLVRLTWFVTDRDEYVAARREIGAVYREIIGRHYPAMSVVIVSGLLEPGARVEIEATAVIGE